MTISVASYNVLADSYVSSERYPGIPSTILSPQWRRPALARHVAGLAADVLCLQEVELEVFGVLEAQLQPRGYQGYYAQKKDRPDGCATFVRSAAFAASGATKLHYADASTGKTASGHVALVVTLQQEGRVVAFANTHLKWDP